MNSTNGTLSTVRERLSRTAEILRGSEVPDEPYRPDEHGPIVGNREFDDRIVELPVADDGAVFVRPVGFVGNLRTTEYLGGP